MQASWGARPRRLGAATGAVARAPRAASLRDAFTERTRRRVRRDSTLSHAGSVWELDQGYLAGRLVTVAHCPLDVPLAPWVEHDDRSYPLHPVDPKANAARRRERQAPTPSGRVDFDPSKALLDRALGRSGPTHVED
jgi:hypothetical protein